MVIGLQKTKKYAIDKLHGELFFALIASFLFFVRIKDLHSGMRAYNKKIIKNLPYEVKVSLPVELICGH